MKILAIDRISDITAGSENANYPATNLSDDHPKKQWKAASGIYETTLTITVPRSSGVAIFNTNATAVAIAISTVNEVEWNTSADGISVSWNTSADGTSIAWGTSTIDVPDQIIGKDEDGVGSLWADWGEIIAPHIITLTLSQNAFKTLEVGIVRAGEVTTFQDPKYGIRERLIDYSIEKQLSNGADYYRKRDVVRTFAFELNADRDTLFYDFMLDIIKSTGKKPHPFRIVHKGSTVWEWVVFCKTDPLPHGVHGGISVSQLNINLKEVA